MFFLIWIIFLGFLFLRILLYCSCKSTSIQRKYFSLRLCLKVCLWIIPIRAYLSLCCVIAYEVHINVCVTFIVYIHLHITHTATNLKTPFHYMLRWIAHPKWHYLVRICFVIPSVKTRTETCDINLNGTAQVVSF